MHSSLFALCGSFGLAASSAALLVVALAAPCAAQFNLFDWTYNDPAGDGYHQLSADSMALMANWPTLGGGTIMGYSARTPVAGRITVHMGYTDFDGACDLSVPVFVVNGTPTILAECSTFDETLVLSVPAGATFELGLQTFNGGFPGQLGFEKFTFDPVPPFAAWTDLGHGLSGAWGVPVLKGISLLYPEYPLTLQLTGAALSEQATLFVGFSALNAPFKGGVLVPSPEALIPGLVTSPLGELSLSTEWPGAPSGFVFYLQAWVKDGGGPFGFSASNALEAQTP